MKPSRRPFFSSLRSGIFHLSLSVVLSAFTAHAIDIHWQGPTASYTNAADWVGGVVPSGTNSAVNSNGTNNIVQINIGDPDWSLNDLNAAGEIDTTGAFTQFGQTVNVSGWMHIGAGTNSIGLYTLNGGTLNVPSGALFLNEGPGSTAELDINGGTLNKGNSPANPIYIGVGNWNGDMARTGTVNMANGTVNSSAEIWIGQAVLGTGLWNMHNGAINSSNWFVVARGGADGTLNMDGGTITHVSGGQPAFIVSDYSGASLAGVGNFNFSGGTVNTIGAEYWIGNGTGANSANSRGTNTISGTAKLTVNNWIAIGRGGVGVLNLSSGSVTKTGGGNITMAAINSSSVGIVNQDGGYVTNTSSGTYIGENGTAVWNMNNGTNLMGQITICIGGSSSGTLNLNGGLFQTTGIGTGSGVALSTLNFNGGTLQAGANNASFISGLIQATVSSGGAVIDSQGFNLTIPQVLQNSGGGGLTKNGSGTLTLTGANGYSGPTTVNAGTLIAGTSSGASGDTTTADGTGYGVIVQSSGGQYNLNNLTVASSTGASLSFDMGAYGNPGFSSAPINVSGTFTPSGTISISIADALPQLGQFPLVHYGTRAGDASFVIASLPVGVTATIVTNLGNSSIDLNITGVNQPRWEGQAGGNWDIGLTTNWINIGTLLPTFYTDGSPVIFDDSATGTTNVNLTTTVAPNKVTVTNNTLPYNFLGSGKISGSTSLNKSGGSSLSILNTGGNDYTGPTTVTGGKLIVTNLANGGSPSAIGASSASPTNLSIGGATFSYAGPAVTINRGYRLTGNSVIDVQGDLKLTGNAQTASGTLAKTGPATMTYAGLGSNSISPANVGGAYQIQNGTVVFDGTGGAQTNNVIGEVWVSCVTNAAANVVVTNSTFGISSWFALGRGNGPSNFLSTAAFNNSTVAVSYANTGTGGAGNGGGISLGYNNGLPNAGSQIMTLSGNTYMTNAGGNFNIAESAGSLSTFNVKDSASFIGIYNRCLIGNASGKGIINYNSSAASTFCTTFGQIFLGGNGGATDTGVGAMNISSGTVRFGNGSGVYIHLANQAGTAPTSYGSLVLSGGLLSLTSNDGIRVGFGGWGSFVQSGGTLLCGRYIAIGANTAGGNGVATFTGGTAGIFNTGFRVLLPDAANATGVFNLGTLAGGNAIFTNLYNSGGNSFIMENSAGGNGTLNANSGTLVLGGAIHRNNTSGGSAVVNLNGGTIQAGANNITLINTTPSSVNVYKGGVTFDSQANTATVTANLLTTFGNGIYPAGGTLTITNGGTGYMGAPLVTVSGGSGSGAMAIATVTGGVVTNIVMTCAGQNYVAGDVITFAFSGGGATTVAPSYLYTLQAGDLTANSGGGVTKVGSGTLYLTGGGTYTGATTVNAGTLSGSGTVFSPVNVSANTTLGVGSAVNTIGTFTANNTVTLAAGGTNFMKVNKTAGTKDLLSANTINYGGTLVVSNMAGTYAAGDSFKLYNATTYNGSFAAISPATPGSGLIWYTNLLATTGTLAISNGLPTVGTNITFNVSGGNLNLSWPSNYLGWRLLVQTNNNGAGIGTNWVTYPNSTNVVSVSVPIVSTNQSVFFRLVNP